MGGWRGRMSESKLILFLLFSQSFVLSLSIELLLVLLSCSIVRALPLGWRDSLISLRAITPFPGLDRRAVGNDHSTAVFNSNERSQLRLPTTPRLDPIYLLNIYWPGYIFTAVISSPCVFQIVLRLLTEPCSNYYCGSHMLDFNLSNNFYFNHGKAKIMEMRWFTSIHIEIGFYFQFTYDFIPHFPSRSFVWWVQQPLSI